MPDTKEKWLQRQQVLADFGELAIRSQNLDEILMEACRLVSEALNADCAKVLEIQEDRRELLVRAGVGWATGVVGAVRLQMSDRSSETYAIKAAAPIIVQDIAEETRFDIPEFMKKAGVVALVNVPIFVPGKQPYGILQVDDTKPRDFGEGEIQFLRTYAMILGPVIDRLYLLEERAKIQRSLRSSEARHRLLIERWAQSIWETNADGVVVKDSPSWRAYTGQSKEEWLGYGWLDAIHPDDRVYAERQWREAVAVEGVVDAEFRIRAPDGRWQWTNVRAVPVRDGTGSVDLWAGMNINIDARKRAESALRESEARMRAILGSALDYAIFTTDPDGIIETWSPGAEAVFGWTAEEAIGEHSAITFVPEDRDRGVPQGELAEAAEKGFAPNVRWHQHKDGRRVFIEGSTRPMAAAAGTSSGFLKIGQDLTDRKRWEERLQQSEERLRSAVEVGRLGLWDWNVVTGEVHWSDEHFRMEGYTVGEVTPSYETWASRLHPDDRQRAETALKHAMSARAEFVHEFRVVHSDGSVHWLSGRGKFFYDDEGRPIRMVGAIVETTEAREWEDRQLVLIAELQHRTRNLISLVRSISDKTARASDSLSDFRERFSDRLEALARVQGLLSRLNDHDRVAFDELIETEFAALGSRSDRVTLNGPKNVRLRSSTVQTLAMAVHELATNAVKYGALGQADAQLAVTWQLQRQDDKGRPWLCIDWRERGVTMPPSGAKPGGRGQGRELIEKALPYQLSAETSYELGPDGVHCTISIPISTSTGRGADDAG